MKNERILALYLSAVVLFVIAAFGVAALAGHGKQSSYWKNKIALAPADAFVDQELLPGFLEATQSFATDTTNGEPIVGATRRSFTDAEAVGWLLEVVDKAEIVRGGQAKTIYGIETSMVFDFRTETKK